MKKLQRFAVLIIFFLLLNTSFASASYFVTYTNKDPTRKFIIVPEDSVSSDIIVDDSVLIEGMERYEVREFRVMNNEEDEIELLYVSYDENKVRFSFVEEDTPMLKRGQAYVFEENNWIVGIKEIGRYQCDDGICDFVNFYIGMKAFCGDEWCNTNENPNTCPIDCPTVCGDDFCSYNEDCEKDGCCNGDEVDFETDVENCGECGKECEVHEECDSGVCLPVCGDGYCVEGETCLLDNCCDGNSIDFNTDSDNCGWCGNYCADNEKCEYGKCITYCGNGVCDSNETCDSCQKDCGCEQGFECYQEKCVESRCLSDLDCSDGNTCTVDVCSGKPKECSNERIRPGCSIDNECVPIGTRIKDLYYCNEDNTVDIMQVDNSTCTNNYECTTNLCKNDKCIKPNVVVRIFSWFWNLF